MCRSSKEVRHFRKSQWRFIQQRVGQLEEGGGDIFREKNLYQLCQQFCQKFYWYLFPSEMKARIQKIQSRLLTQRRPAVSKKATGPINKTHLIGIIFARRPIRRGRVRHLS